MKYRLQIRFRDNGDPFWMRTWCINEPFDDLEEYRGMARGLLDDTVDAMRIVDAKENSIVVRVRTSYQNHVKREELRKRLKAQNG